MNDDEVSSIDIRVGKKAGKFEILAKIRILWKTIRKKIIMVVNRHFHENCQH